MLFSDLLPYLIGQGPVGTGPQLPNVPKAQSSFTGQNVPAVRMSTPTEFMAAFNQMAQTPSEIELRKAQSKLAGLQGSALDQQVELMKQLPASLQSVMAQIGAGEQGGAAGGAVKPAVWGDIGGGTGGGASVNRGGGSVSDPRGVVPVIREAAVRYGHDPDTVVEGFSHEGIGTYTGDKGTSFGAPQLHIGGGLGDEFIKETGLDPRDQKNEPAMIDWAVKNLDRTGWTPYHGPIKKGFGPRDGLSVAPPGVRAGANPLAGVPNFSGMMMGNQGPTYSPVAPVYGSLSGGGGAMPAGGGTVITPAAGATGAPASTEPKPATATDIARLHSRYGDNIPTTILRDGMLAPGAAVNSKGEVYSTALTTMTPQERTNEQAAYQFIKNNPTSYMRQLLAGGGAGAAAPVYGSLNGGTAPAATMTGNPGANGVNPSLPPTTQPPGGIPSAPAPGAVAPVFGAFAPPAAAAQPGMPPQGGMATGGALGQPQISPLQAAIIKLGVVSRLAKMGDVAVPLEQMYQNLPQVVQEKAAATARGEKGVGLQYDPLIAAEVAKRKLPFTPVDLRPGGATGLYDEQGNFNPKYVAPTLQQSVGPDGGKSFVYMTPQGVVPTGQVAALGPGRAAELEQGGKNIANLSTPVAPPAAAQNEGGAAQSGSPLATGLTSTIPPIKEPLLAPKDLETALPRWNEINSQMASSIGMAQQAEHRLMNIADAFKIIESGGMKTNQAHFDSLMKAIGIPLSLTGDPSAVQLALHENYRATLQVLGEANKRFTQNEFRVTSEQSEHPNLQPEANLTMLGEDIAALRQHRAMANDWMNARINTGARNPEAFQTRWLETNPLSKIADAVKKEIGPLKGMPGNTGSPRAAGTTTSGFKWELH